MLIHRHDAPVDDEEVQAFLRSHDFGQLLLPGAGRAFPLVVPTHFVMEARDRALLHLARPNPAFEAIAENPRGVLAVVGAYAYVPSTWNAGEEAPPEWGVPTSYYAAAQLEGTVEVIDEPPGIGDALARMMAHFEPTRAGPRPEAGDNPYGRQFGAIRAIRLRVENVRAKFKFGGNRPLAHRLRVAERLQERGSDLDLEARAHLLRRSGEPASGERRPAAQGAPKEPHL